MHRVATLGERLSDRISANAVNAEVIFHKGRHRWAIAGILEPMTTSNLIPGHQFDRLKDLCREFDVKRLDLFGSAARSHEAPGDYDFLVEFDQLGPGQYADQYFGLLEALEHLFGRPIDLVVRSSIRNRFFLEAIERDLKELYAA